MKRKPHRIADADLVELLSGLHSSEDPRFEAMLRVWHLLRLRYESTNTLRQRLVVKTRYGGSLFPSPFVLSQKPRFITLGEDDFNAAYALGFPDYSTESVDRVNIHTMGNLPQTATFMSLVTPEDYVPYSNGKLTKAQADKLIELVVGRSEILKSSAKVTR